MSASETRMPLREALGELDACSDAMTWACIGSKTWESAWADCPDPDWMTWLIDECGVAFDEDEYLRRCVEEAIRRFPLPDTELAWHRPVWVIRDRLTAAQKVELDRACADIVREMVPFETVAAAAEAEIERRRFASDDDDEYDEEDFCEDCDEPIDLCGCAELDEDDDDAGEDADDDDDEEEGLDD